MSITPFNAERIFPELGGDMLEITCRNHPTARYLMKNMRGRGLHFIAWAEDMPETEEERIEQGWTGVLHSECPCPISDLVLKEDGRQVFD